MPTHDLEKLRAIKTLPSLVKYLRDELDWPVDADNTDEISFDYRQYSPGDDTRYLDWRLYARTDRYGLTTEGIKIVEAASTAH